MLHIHLIHLGEDVPPVAPRRALLLCATAWRSLHASAHTRHVLYDLRHSATGPAPRSPSFCAERGTLVYCVRSARAVLPALRRAATATDGVPYARWLRAGLAGRKLAPARRRAFHALSALAVLALLPGHSCVGGLPRCVARRASLLRQAHRSPRSGRRARSRLRLTSPTHLWTSAQAHARALDQDWDIPGTQPVARRRRGGALAFA